MTNQDLIAKLTALTKKERESGFKLIHPSVCSEIDQILSQANQEGGRRGDTMQEKCKNGGKLCMYCSANKCTARRYNYFNAKNPPTQDLPAPTSQEGGCLVNMGKEIVTINTANGWNVLKPEQWGDTYKIPAILALIHSEVSEALEGFRKNDKANFEEELADVIIRVLDCATGLGLNMDKAIADKLVKNRTRGFRHGGKKV